MRRCAACQVDFPDALEFCPSDGAQLPPIVGHTQVLHDPMIGTTIDGRYAVESVLGEGGMGMVYAGRHVIIDKRVAIKVLHKEAAADEASAQRFLAEAKAASKIGQQNIVDITDFGVLPDGHAYFVMEFLNGPTLARVMRDGPLPPARAVAIAQQIGRGLVAAHGKNITHRDLKPENIFVLERDGSTDAVKIVDFGIARDGSTKKRLTVAGMVMGTPEYMAPEQASGQETDHRADQYALGCILYEMLTAETPFRGDNPMQTLTKHVFEAVVPPSKRRPDLDIPAPLELVIMRALSKKRDDRYPELDAMMRALHALEPSLQGITIPEGAEGRERAELASAPTTYDSEGALQVVAPRRGLVLAGFVAVACVAVVVALALRKPAPGPVVPVAPPPVVAAMPAVPPPVAENVQITLRSWPPGAQVSLNDEDVGTTPVPTRQPKTGAPMHFVFRKFGFRDASRDVIASKDADVEVRLQAEAAPTKAPIRPPRRPDGRPEPHGTTAPRGGDRLPTARPPVTGAGHAPSELRNPFADPK